MEIRRSALAIEDVKVAIFNRWVYNKGLFGFHLAAMTIVLSLSLMLGGCIVTRHPSAIASSSTPLGLDYIEIGPAENASCAFLLLGIPLGGKNESSVIIDGMLKERGANALVGLTVEHTRSLFPLLPFTGSDCTTVKGRAVRGGK